MKIKIGIMKTCTRLENNRKKEKDRKKRTNDKENLRSP